MTYDDFKKELINTNLTSEVFYKEMLKYNNQDILNNFYEKFIVENNQYDNIYDKIEYYIDNKNINISNDVYIEDSYKSYVNDINKIPSLSKEERVEILKKIDELKKQLEKDGITKESLIKELKKINYRIRGFNCRLLKKCLNEIDNEKNKELVLKIKKYYLYEELVEKFMECNLKLVVRFAKIILTQKVDKNLSILDLIQNGNMGLRRAIEKYDINTGFQFSTYAVNWIKQFINRGIDTEENTIVIPSHVHTDYKRLRKAEEEFKLEYKRQPTNSELAEILGFDEERIPYIRSSVNAIVSLDMSINDEKDTTLADMLPDENNEIEDNIMQLSVQQEIMDLINDSPMTYREKLVVILRFGLDINRYMSEQVFIAVLNGKFNFYELRELYKKISSNPNPMKLHEVAELVGVATERIRQIEAKAKRKIKYLAVSRGLNK